MLSLLLLLFMAVVDTTFNTQLLTHVRLLLNSSVYLPRQVLFPDGALAHYPWHFDAPVVLICVWIRVLSKTYHSCKQLTIMAISTTLLWYKGGGRMFLWLPSAAPDPLYLV